MGQQHDLAGFGELDEFRVDRRLVLEHVEAGASDAAGFDQTGERVLVDHLAARGVDDIGLGAEQLEPARRQQMISRGLSLIHISEPTRQAEISYAVFCLKKKK